MAKNIDARGNEVKTERYNAPVEHKEIKSKWWEQPEADMHAHVFGVVKKIREQQSYRTLNNLRFARLYANMEIMGLQAGLFARVADPTNWLTNRLSLNVIAACIDTASSKIGKNKTRPLFLTEDGNWTLQRRAELLTRFMEGAFDTMGTGTGDSRTLYGIGRRAFVDAAVFGTGAVKFFADSQTKSVKAERCLIEEIVIDETEGMYEGPRQLHQEKLAHREVIADLFPSKHRDKVMRAASALEGTALSSSSADMIKIVESWHLPSTVDGKDGRKAISIENCTLDVDDWAKDYFPFLFKRWKPRVLGFYGSGIAEELIGIQLEINKLIRTIAVAQHLMSVPQVWLEIANKANAKQIDNEIGGIKYYTGRDPIFMTPNAMNSEVYNHLENLYQKAFEIIGISQLSATSQKPAGLDSGVAIRTAQDIESERFALVQQRDQDFYIEAAYLTMDLMEDIDNPRVRVSDGNSTKEIFWKQVRIDREKLKVRAFPTDVLPSQPAGKLQRVQELMQAGFFDKEESIELLDFPDLKHVVSLKVSSRQNIRRLLEKMVETGEYYPPEPYGNLQLGRMLAQAYYEKGQIDGMPEDRLDLLRRYMDDVKAALEPPAPPMVPPPGAADAGLAATAQAEELGGAMPMAQPEAPPVSDMLPVAQ